MTGKKMRVVLILLASVALPYVWFNDNLATWAKDRWNEVVNNKPSAGSFRFNTVPRDAGETAALPSDQPEGDQPPGPTTTELSEVLRFDVTPEWVMQRWDRVSTVRRRPDLTGMRVALVTGTELDDLAGSLTYHFDHQQQVKRISFFGRTGDAQKIINEVTSKYGMRAEPTLGTGMYVTRWNGTPTSGLRISYAQVVRADNPYQRLQVALEINRPDRYYGLSDEFAAQLMPQRTTQR